MSSNEQQPFGSNGSGKSQQSVGSTSIINDREDAYGKIKAHAVSILLLLFKNNNVTFNIKTLWHPIFPSFLVTHRADFYSLAQKVNGSGVDLDNYSKATLEENLREPTFVYLMISGSENGTKFRSSVCQSLSVLLENSTIISKW